MSDRELAKSLIDHVPESKLPYVVAYIQGVMVPDETPNAATLEAMAELDSGGGEPLGKITMNSYDAAREL